MLLKLRGMSELAAVQDMLKNVIIVSYAALITLFWPPHLYV